MMQKEAQPRINPVRNSSFVFGSPRELFDVVTRAAERQGIISNGIKINKMLLEAGKPLVRIR